MSLGPCKYFACITAYGVERDCSEEASKNCQTRKFLDRYGEDYLSMGCGALMFPPEGLLRKIKDE